MKMYLIVVVFLLSGWLYATNIDLECAQIVQRFAASSRSAFPSEKHVVIAVIPFESRSIDLEQRHIGFGVSELMINAIITYGKGIFSTVERSQLDRILDEQALGKSALTRNPVETWKLLNAELLVIGTVVKVKKSYRLNCTMVLVKTGEVLTQYTGDLEIDKFEKRVRNHIIPRKKSIGIYTGMTMISVSKAIQEPVVHNGVVYSHVEPLFNAIYFATAGARFYLTKSVMVNISSSFGNPHGIVYERNSVQTESSEGPILDLLAITVNYNCRLNPKLDIFIGGGMNYIFSFLGGANSYVENSLFPNFNIGIEWRPSQKIGIGFFYSYHMQENIVYGNAGGRHDLPEVKLFKLSTYKITPSLTFYF